MKISRSTGYALVAVGFIAGAEKNNPVQAATVSKEYNIPLEYLLKILQQLVRVSVLRSKRGPRGGFFLARNDFDAQSETAFDFSREFMAVRGIAQTGGADGDCRFDAEFLHLLRI